MAGRRQRTNKVLATVSILLCISSGLLLTRSSARTSVSDSSPDMIVADNTEHETQNTQLSVPQDAETPEDFLISHTPTPAEANASPEETPVLEENEKKEPVSEEAAAGIWTPVGSNWYFLVNGTGVTGWLTDTDGKRYFFDSNGVMQTGWLEDNGKKYYLNPDGVMQTGEVIIDGLVYLFGSDGVLKEEGVKETREELLYYSSPRSSQDAVPVSQNDAEKQENTESKKEEPDPRVSAAPSAEPEVPSAGMIALTFDDGPSDFTSRLLDCLEENNAKATFFTVGTQVEYLPDLLSRMEAMGCEVGNHSYDHPDLTTLSFAEIQSQFSGTDALIQAQLGHSAGLIRPPYGNINDNVSSASGRPLILWSVDTEDALDPQNADASKIAQLALSGAQDGAVILMHDIFKTSVDAAEILIPQLIQEGYELVTISQLASAKGIRLEAGNTYSVFP